MAATEKWWAMTCRDCGGFVPVRPLLEAEITPPMLEGEASCARCHAPNALVAAELFVIDGRRLRRIRRDSPSDYVK